MLGSPRTPHAADACVSPTWHSDALGSVAGSSLMSRNRRYMPPLVQHWIVPNAFQGPAPTRSHPGSSSRSPAGPRPHHQRRIGLPTRPPRSRTGPHRHPRHRRGRCWHGGDGQRQPAGRRGGISGVPVWEAPIVRAPGLENVTEHVASAVVRSTGWLVHPVIGGARR